MCVCLCLWWKRGRGGSSDLKSHGEHERISTEPAVHPQPCTDSALSSGALHIHAVSFKSRHSRCGEMFDVGFNKAAR